MMVCLTCNTKNHSLYYICPFLQNPTVGQVQDHERYHLDDPSHKHQNVDVIKPDVSDAFKDIQIFPVTSAFHPLDHTILKTYGLTINFMIMIRVPLLLLTGMLVLKKSLIELIESPLETDHKKFPARKWQT